MKTECNNTDWNKCVECTYYDNCDTKESFRVHDYRILLVYVVLLISILLLII